MEEDDFLVAMGSKTVFKGVVKLLWMLDFSAEPKSLPAFVIASRTSPHQLALERLLIPFEI